MAEPIKLSPSALNGFLACPRCFWLDRHGYEQPSMHMPLYNVMDGLEKKYYDKHRKEGLPPLLKGKIPYKLADEALVMKLRQYLGWTDEKLGAKLWGKIDDCFVAKDGTLVVLDNKTRAGEFKELYDSFKFQLETYAFLLSKNGFKVNLKTGYIVYFVPNKESDFDKGIKFEIDVHPVKLDVDRVPKTFKKAVEVVKQSKAPAHHKECEVGLWLKAIGEL